MEENCIKCFYSETASIQHFSIFGNNICKCLNENSPYYENIVSDNNYCRLYVNYDEYIKLKDRKESIIKIKNKYK